MHVVFAITINSKGFRLCGDTVDIFIAALAADSVDMVDHNVCFLHLGGSHNHEWSAWKLRGR